MTIQCFQEGEGSHWRKPDDSVRSIAALGGSPSRIIFGPYRHLQVTYVSKKKDIKLILYIQAVWKMQYRGSLGEALIHILIMGNSLIHTKIARTLIRSVRQQKTKKIMNEITQT